MNAVVAPSGPAGVADGEPAFTYGWDTVSAIPVPHVNAAIVAAGSSPPGFEHVPADGGSAAVRATFGPWQVTSGGDGRNLRMSVPMPVVTLGTTTVEDVVATIEITLADLPHTEAVPPARGTLRKLVPRTTTHDPVDDPVVVVVDVGAPHPLGIVQRAVISAGLSAWANTNLDQFTHVFAVVNIDDEIDGDAQWAFVTPSYLDYAYLDGASADTSVFAVLCTTGGRPGDRLTPQVSPNAIPQGTGGGFLISAERYLTDLMVPALCHCYPGLDADAVSVASDASSVNLRPGVAVSLPPVSHDGSSYRPELTRLDILVRGQTVQITSQTRTAVSPGITAITDATHWYHVTLVTRDDGSQTLEYVESQPASVEHSTEQEPGIEILKWMIIAATTIGLIVAGILTDGAAFVVAAVVIGALGGLAAAAPEIIAVANTDASPSIDALVANTSAPIVWPDVAFRLSSAGLNESLQLGGTLDKTRVRNLPSTVVGPTWPTGSAGRRRPRRRAAPPRAPSAAPPAG